MNKKYINKYSKRLLHINLLKFNLRRELHLKNTEKTYPKFNDLAADQSNFS